MNDVFLHNLTLKYHNKLENDETQQHLCTCTSHVLREQEFANLQSIECFYLLIIIQVYFYWIFVPTEKKLSLPHIGFEDTPYDELSIIGIPEILLNIVSCHGFSQEENQKVILMWRIKLVLYYLSKGFVMLEKYFQDLKKIPTWFKQRNHAVAMNVNDLVMTCNTDIVRR